jgi:hypothetical protein
MDAKDSPQLSWSPRDLVPTGAKDSHTDLYSYRSSQVPARPYCTEIYSAIHKTFPVRWEVPAGHWWCGTNTKSIAKL